MRERLEGVPGVAVLFTTPLGMRIDEGLGGTPADLSVRIFGPDLDELARLARAGRSAHCEASTGLTDLRAEQLTGLPQLQIASNREATARVGLAPGDVIRAMRIGLVGEEGVADLARPAPLRPRRAAARRSARHVSTRSARCSSTATTARRFRSASSPRSTQTFGPAAIRREAGTRRIAVEASVSGPRSRQHRGGGPAACWPTSSKLPAGYFFDLGGRVESQARASRALTLAIGAALFGVFVLLLPRAGLGRGGGDDPGHGARSPSSAASSRC